jgi:hypothetical protein
MLNIFSPVRYLFLTSISMNSSHSRILDRELYRKKQVFWKFFRALASSSLFQTFPVLYYSSISPIQHSPFWEIRVTLILKCLLQINALSEVFYIVIRLFHFLLWKGLNIIYDYVYGSVMHTWFSLWKLTEKF